MARNSRHPLRSYARAFAAAGFVLVIARSSRGQDCPPTPGWQQGVSSGNVSGSARIMTAKEAIDVDGTQSSFWLSTSDGKSPRKGDDAVGFVMRLVGPTNGPPLAILTCSGASWSALSSGQPVPLSSLCGVHPTNSSWDNPAGSLQVIDPKITGVLVFDLSVVPGTVTLTSALDASGNGSVELRLDVPDVEITTVAIVWLLGGGSVGSPPQKVHFSATALQGVAKYESQVRNCFASSSGCDCTGS